jgi:uncharacterized protein (DUF1800 family)
MKETTSRRGFFNQLFETSSRNVQAGLEVYQNPLTITDAYHLLRRTCIVLDHNFAQTLVGKTAQTAIDQIIQNTKGKTNPSPPPFWNESFPDPNIDPNGASGNDGKWRSQNYELQLWWLRLMQADTNSLMERLTLFWHGHFTSQYNICNLIPAQMMYRQNLLFRQRVMGNFGEFLKDISLDGAMLKYLNGNENINEAPNENYARELMELYSLGVGNYTEEDIREAARILTGWKVNQFQNGEKIYTPFLRAGYFDKEEKSFFGTTFKVDYEINEQNVRSYSIDKLIDTIISKKGDIVAKFMATKLYKLFVYSKPNPQDTQFINELASSFQNNNFDLEKTIKTILTSAHFFDTQNRGLQITSPAESMVNFTYHFSTREDRRNNIIKDLGMELLNPPNVAGWPGYRSWITTKTLPLSIQYFSEILDEQSLEKIGTWASGFVGYNDSYALTEEICLLFLGRLPDEARVDKLMNILLGGAPYYEWPTLSQNKENAGLRVKALIKEIVKTPEFYLR